MRYDCVRARKDPGSRWRGATVAIDAVAVNTAARRLPSCSPALLKAWLSLDFYIVHMITSRRLTTYMAIKKILVKRLNKECTQLRSKNLDDDEIQGL